MARLAVVDTNILVSALLKRGTPPAAVVGGIRSGALQPVVCREIIEEYTAVLARPRLRLPGRDVAELLTLIAGLSRWVYLPAPPAGIDLPDPDDWPFVAAALAAKCPVITGNVRHFPPRLGVEVVTAAAWTNKTP